MSSRAKPWRTTTGTVVLVAAAAFLLGYGFGYAGGGGHLLTVTVRPELSVGEIINATLGLFLGIVIPWALTRHANALNAQGSLLSSLTNEARSNLRYIAAQVRWSTAHPLTFDECQDISKRFRKARDSVRELEFYAKGMSSKARVPVKEAKAELESFRTSYSDEDFPVAQFEASTDALASMERSYETILSHLARAERLLMRSGTRW